MGWNEKDFADALKRAAAKVKVETPADGLEGLRRKHSRRALWVNGSAVLATAIVATLVTVLVVPDRTGRIATLGDTSSESTDPVTSSPSPEPSPEPSPSPEASPAVTQAKPTPSPSPSPPPPCLVGDLSLALRLDKDSYAPGEPVRMTFNAKNVSGKTCTLVLGGSSQPWAEFQIDREGTRVKSSACLVHANRAWTVWEAGHAEVYEWTWDQQTTSCVAEPRPADPGAYRAIGVFQGLDGKDPDGRDFTRPTVDFEIRA